MSVREDIAANIVSVLSSATTPTRIKYVTREPFDFDKLSNAQFPAILVRSSNESREDSTLGGSMSQRMAVTDYDLVCFVKAKNIDTARNLIVETVEESLEADRTRGGKAIDTQITSVEVDDGSIDPVGGVIITVQITYSFTRGTT
jgi:hypothetical protein|tara:strand:+ start:639 stop:1073 length:435 start_codon:yes stop_codon:yes gene_type:complete